MNYYSRLANYPASEEFISKDALIESWERILENPPEWMEEKEIQQVILNLKTRKNER